MCGRRGESYTGSENTGAGFAALSSVCGVWGVGRGVVDRRDIYREGLVKEKRSMGREQRL